jgi:hypothetical protein
MIARAGAVECERRKDEGKKARTYTGEIEEHCFFIAKSA